MNNEIRYLAQHLAGTQRRRGEAGQGSAGTASLRVA